MRAWTSELPLTGFSPELYTLATACGPFRILYDQSCIASRTYRKDTTDLNIEVK